MTTPTLTEQLDQLEANLPAVPARVLRLQRTLAGAGVRPDGRRRRRAVADSTKNFLDTARISGKTVTGQATAAGDDVVDRAASVPRPSPARPRRPPRRRHVGPHRRPHRDRPGRRPGPRVSPRPRRRDDRSCSTRRSTPSTTTPGSGRPYEQWTKAELLERAKELDVEGRSGLNKKQLIAALRNA